MNNKSIVHCNGQWIKLQSLDAGEWNLCRDCSMRQTEKCWIYLSSDWIWIFECKRHRKVAGNIGKKGKVLCMGDTHSGNGLDGMSCQLEWHQESQLLPHVEYVCLCVRVFVMPRMGMCICWTIICMTWCSPRIDWVRVPAMRDVHHELLSFLDPLYSTRSDDEPWTCMYFSYSVYHNQHRWSSS